MNQLGLPYPRSTRITSSCTTSGLAPTSVTCSQKVNRLSKNPCPPRPIAQYSDLEYAHHLFIPVKDWARVRNWGCGAILHSCVITSSLAEKKGGQIKASRTFVHALIKARQQRWKDMKEALQDTHKHTRECVQLRQYEKRMVQRVRLQDTEGRGNDTHIG